MSKAPMAFDVALVADAALALELGMFAATHCEMHLRATRLLAGARGAQPTP
ncbi:hypothetical protein [Sphingomonas oligophenolica]|uniref:hypothetical protein n=1 Tax=Sphingomonas oligophenolica TaxID=301154 RepID=UPI0019D699D4|nr:hypothetical protein [Sphingomonas oligophenolica]